MTFGILRRGEDEIGENIECYRLTQNYQECLELKDPQIPSINYNFYDRLSWQGGVINSDN